MQTSKLAAYGSLTLLVLTAVAAYIPTASAQQEGFLSVSLAAGYPKYDDSQLNNGRLQPEASKLDVKLQFEVKFPPTVGVCPLGTVTLQFTPTNPDWGKGSVVVPSTVTKQQSQQQQQAGTIDNFETTLTIVTTRKAPAFQTDQYKVTVKSFPSGGAATGCNAKAAGDFVVPVTVTNDYLPIMEYQPARYSLKTGQNKDILFSVKMTNFGNGDTKVTASPAVWAGKNKLESVIPPSQTTLESKSVSGEKALFSKDVVISAKTPHSNGYTNSIYTFSMSFDATAVQTGQNIAKDTQALTLSVQVQGVYVPGFDPAGAIASLGVALLILGFTRRRVS